jgi:hypothetical protein
MEIDLIVTFILTGFYLEIPFGTETSRMRLLQILGEVEGLNKKNGVFEIFKKNNVFFYLGFGGRGMLSGIKIGDISFLKIHLSFIDELLTKNKIHYKKVNKNMTYILDNGVKIFFNEIEGQKLIKEIVKADSKITEDKLLMI